MVEGMEIVRVRRGDSSRQSVGKSNDLISKNNGKRGADGYDVVNSS